jgi:AcrR family transcriptional regulator
MYELGMRRTVVEAARTRALLIDTALLVFAETGVSTARLADIAARANLTRGAVYHHFEDKTALYAAVIQESWDTVTAPVWSTLGGDDPFDQRLTAFLVAWLRHLREDERFRALLTITINGANPLPADTDEHSAKAQGLADWRLRLTELLTSNTQHLAASADPTAVAASVLSWLCGTAVLAAADPDLLPPGDPDGVAPLLGGILP